MIREAFIRNKREVQTVFYRPETYLPMIFLSGVRALMAICM
jgi:hypothetical protein